MIFYFSGTGNSLAVAKIIAEAQNEQLVSLAKAREEAEGSFSHSFAKGELLAFVYPVYAWGPPEIVLDFIRKMDIRGETPYTVSVATCGGEEGNSTRLFQKVLAAKSLELDCAYTIQMPNNYILGMNVDSEEEEQRALRDSMTTIAAINLSIKNRQSKVWQVIRGRAAGVKTALGNPLFNRFARGTSQFYAEDSCTRCKLCEKICPLHTITVTDKPSWNTSCTLCLACINRCPVQAIQHGRSTVGRGRYVHPDLRPS